jgi:hypothetical protein
MNAVEEIMADGGQFMQRQLRSDPAAMQELKRLLAQGQTPSMGQVVSDAPDIMLFVRFGPTPS